MNDIHNQPETDYPPFPESMLSASACELTDITLQVVNGAFPPDLYGHLFIVAPIGSVSSGGLPNPSGTHIWNGNGLVYRLDFPALDRTDELPAVKLKTRLVKPPCYYADKATRPGSRYNHYQFLDCGLARFSPTLGMRNELNTAFLPLRFSGEAQARLLVTFDGGRPYEIDTETLEVVTPIGANTEWRPAMELDYPFAPVLSTAHPYFDARTEELFTVNYGRSLVNFLETIPFIHQLRELPQAAKDLLEKAAGSFGSEGFVQTFCHAPLLFFKRFLQPLQDFWPPLLGVEDFVYLIRWDGSGDFERWQLVLPDGSPVKIEQTMHQIGISRDYVIVMDTSLKFGLEQILNQPIPENEPAERLLRTLLTRPQLPDARIYIVRRDDLVDGERPARDRQAATVTARPITLLGEAAHFLVNYDNPDDRIILHVAHESATDVSEWIRRYDRSVYSPHGSVRPELEGMISTAADIGRLGRYTLDAQNAEILESTVIYDPRCTWGLGLYACCDSSVSGKRAGGAIANIYWQSLGFWPDLLAQFIFELYKDYPHRLVPIDQLLQIPDRGKGRPSCLFRLNTETMKIVDSYEFPLISEDGSWDSHIVNSPQFVPKAPGRQHSTRQSSTSADGLNTDDQNADDQNTDDQNTDDTTAGYLICTVVAKDRKEIWIFDGQDLAQGPLCKLSHPMLDFGYTIHTAWLPDIAHRTAEYCIPVRQDYQDLVCRKPQAIQDLFEQTVYPHFESKPASA